MRKYMQKKEELPCEAFAIVGNREDPDTWQLDHHRQGISRALRGKVDIEKTVDWEQLSGAVAALSPAERRRQGREFSPEAVLAAAAHFAAHYAKAGKPLPDILAALV